MLPRRMCVICGGGTYKSYYCRPCGDVAQEIRFSAHAIVLRAVKAGILSPAGAARCVDCGGPASQYDHRRYSEPLRVDATCPKCNRARGVAWDLPELIALLRPMPRAEYLAYWRAKNP